MQIYQTIEVDIAAGVASVALNRPGVHNAFNAEMISELTAIAAELSSGEDIRAVVLSGNGSSFSAGADVNWMRASLDYSTSENLEDARRMSDMFAALDSLPMALVGRVHGAALGGGMGLIACCDVVVAADDTVFGFTETRLGIVPAVISRFVLPKMGASWARALYLTGERFDAEVARSLHLVHWMVPQDDLNDTVTQKLGDLLASGPAATRAAKALIRDLSAARAGETRELTAQLIAAMRASPEGQEGLRAFLEKRKPAWRDGS